MEVIIQVLFTALKKWNLTRLSFVFKFHVFSTVCVLRLEHNLADFSIDPYTERIQK